MRDDRAQDFAYQAADAERRRHLADEAANGLLSRQPQASAALGFPLRQIVGLCAPLVYLVALAAISAHAATALFALCVAALLVLISLRIAAATLPPRWANRRRLSRRDLPVVSVLAPVYREARVLPQLLRSLTRLDYPSARLDIKIIVEADDLQTLDAARRLERHYRFETVCVPAGAPRTKPRALNYALHFARGEIVTVYDAEDCPHPGQLRAAAEAFAAGSEDLACVQAPLNWFNADRNWMTRQFALEYAAQFHAILPLLARFRLPLPLGGTSNHFRKSALNAVGGWDPHNVTEDADLGFRLCANGYRSDVIAPMTMEEAPERLRPWMRQRTRWLKGHAQTWAVHMRDPLGLCEAAGPGALASLNVTLGATVLSALLHGPAALYCLVQISLALTTGSLAIIGLGLLAAGYGAAMLCAAAGARRAGVPVRAVDLCRMPLYWPLQTIAAICALRELQVRPYFWAKTEHGFTAAPDTPCLSNSHSPSWRSARSSLPSRRGAPNIQPIRQKVRASSPGPLSP
tara:strand:+ start:108 stop:1664 length:1557 start_codon:yes stop_codon:yes gene_type:complete